MKTALLAALFLALCATSAQAQFDCSQVNCGGCLSDCLQCHVGGSVGQNPVQGCYCDGNCSDGCPNGSCPDGYGGCFVGAGCQAQSSERTKSSSARPPTASVVRLEDVILSYLSFQNGVFAPATAGKLIHAYPAGSPQAAIALSLGAKLDPGIILKADGLLLPKNHVPLTPSSKAPAKR